MAEAKRMDDGWPKSAYYVLSHDLHALEPLDSDEGQQVFLDHYHSINSQVDRPIGLVIFDNLASLTHQDDDKPDAWKDFYPLIDRLSQEGVATITVHHAGHNKDRFIGSARKAFHLHNVIHLHAEDSEDDTRFRLEFQKARGRRPDAWEDYRDVIVALDAEENWRIEEADPRQAKKPTKPPAGYKTAMQALGHVLAVAGEHRSVTPSGPRVVCVMIDQWRDELRRRGVFALDDKSHLTNTDRSRFSRWRTHASDNGDIAIQQELVWRPSQ